MHKYCGYASLYEPFQPWHHVSWTEVPLVGLCMTTDFAKTSHPPPRWCQRRRHGPYQNGSGLSLFPPKQLRNGYFKSQAERRPKASLVVPHGRLWPLHRNRATENDLSRERFYQEERWHWCGRGFFPRGLLCMPTVFLVISHLRWGLGFSQLRPWART